MNFNNMNFNNMNFNNISLQNKEWNEEFSGLSSLAVGLIAVACVVAGGFAGAFLGPVIGAMVGTASTMATVTTANALLNGGNLGDALYEGQKAVISKEGGKSIATSVALAWVSYKIGEWIGKVKAEYNSSPDIQSGLKQPVSTGSSNLKSALPKNSKIGVNVEYKMNPVTGKMGWFKEGTTNQVSWFETYITGSQNPLFKGLNIFPGSPSFADFHDALSAPGIYNQLSIPPAYFISQVNAVAPYLQTYLTYDYANERTKNNN
jgi:hypothetical protein